MGALTGGDLSVDDRESGDSQLRRRLMRLASRDYHPPEHGSPLKMAMRIHQMQQEFRNGISQVQVIERILEMEPSDLGAEARHLITCARKCARAETEIREAKLAAAQGRVIDECRKSFAVAFEKALHGSISDRPELIMHLTDAGLMRIRNIVFAHVIFGSTEFVLKLVELTQRSAKIDDYTVDAIIHACKPQKTANQFAKQASLRTGVKLRPKSILDRINFESDGLLAIAENLALIAKAENRLAKYSRSEERAYDEFISAHAKERWEGIYGAET